MPGRTRIKVLATASGAPAQAIEARLSAAVAQHGPDLHQVDGPVNRSPADPEGQPEVDTISADIRVSRSGNSEAVRQALRAVGRQGSEVRVFEHECYHGLEDEPGAKPCGETLTVWRSVNGEHIPRPKGRP